MNAPGEMQTHKFVFICGLHRSGTSVLFRALRAHPQISGFANTGSPHDEGVHLQSVYTAPRYLGGAGAFAFNPLAYHDETSPLVSAENRQQLWDAWHPHWDLRLPYLIEKSPGNLLLTRFLQAMFPNVYFVIIMRHPVAVSLATRKWYRRSHLRYYRLDRLIEHWLVAYDRYRRDAHYVQRALVIRYEDFVIDPDAVLGTIYAFLGLAPQPNLESIQRDIDRQYFVMWRTLATSVPWGAFIKYIIWRYNDEVKRFGYDLQATPSNLGLQ